MNDSLRNVTGIHRDIESCLSADAIVSWWSMAPGARDRMIAHAMSVTRHVANAETLADLSEDEYYEEFFRQVIDRIELRCTR